MEIEFILDWVSSSGSDCFIGRFINVWHGDTGCYLWLSQQVDSYFVGQTTTVHSVSDWTLENGVTSGNFIWNQRKIQYWKWWKYLVYVQGTIFYNVNGKSYCSFIFSSIFKPLSYVIQRKESSFLHIAKAFMGYYLVLINL